MVLAVALTRSHIAIGAMVVSLLAYTLFIRPRAIFIFLIIGALVTGIGVTKHFNPVVYVKTHDNGRFAQWEQIIKDWKDGAIPQEKRKYTFTGMGLGVFTYLYHDIHKSIYWQAHNDWLEILSNLGLFGFILFNLSIILMLFYSLRSWRSHADYRKTRLAALMCSFLCIALCALGTFPWQLGPHIYFTIAVVGLLHNKSVLIKEEKECLKNYSSRYLQLVY